MRDGPLWQLAALVVAEWRLLVRKPESYLPLRRPAAMVLLGVLAFLASDMGKDPVYSIKELLGLGGVLYTVLWQIQLLCNRFGSESGTATLLFSLSIPKARLLLGKNLALLMLLLLLDIAPQARVFGATAPRLPNTSCIAMPGVRAETQVMALDLASVAVSAGAACSSGKVTRSAVLAAMGVEDAEADTAVRISCGWNTVSEDIERLIAAWRDLYIRVGHSGNRQARAA